MRLALHTDYALRTLIYLAGRQERATAQEIAGFYQISGHHLAKVVALLARQGWIRSVRGLGGGLELTRPAEQISLGEVIVSCEGQMHLLECVGTPAVCVIQPTCRLRTILAQAERLMLDFLQSVKLSDVVTPGGQLTEFLPLIELTQRAPPASAAP